MRDALPKAVKYLLNFGTKEQTRNGDALVARAPVCIHYHIPKQHVLVNPVRDANPFFHLIEAMWMLSGSDDGALLDNYIKDFTKTFGFNGRIWDAYGYRWRHRLGHDQLDTIIQQLRENPLTRQAVLQMWDDDLLSEQAKPCNIAATFRIRNNLLDMTVFNRSNDLIWGACGANAVHFPILQEYVAAMIGVRMGEYWQISTNLHLYENHIEMLLKRIPHPNFPNSHEETPNLYTALKTPFYEEATPLVAYPESFNNELDEVMLIIEDINKDLEVFEDNLSQPFLRDVVLPMAHAHRCYKHRAMADAFEWMEHVIADDWRRAGTEWIKRRTSVRVTETADDTSV